MLNHDRIDVPEKLILIKVVHQKNVIFVTNGVF